ncbi:MAG: ATP-binding protein [Gammaproteobacteria bacterium]|nr:ATP-binding protein [Gammaproteobacteria bacterium]
MKIESISIGDKEVLLSDMTLIVGANATGKTTLLRELYQASVGNQSSPCWYIKAEPSFSADEDNDLRCWLDNMVFDFNQRYYSLVKGPICNEVTISKKDYDRYKKTGEVSHIKEGNTNFKGELKRCLIHHLGVEERLSSIPPLLLASDSIKIDCFNPEQLFVAIDKNRELINEYLSELFSRKLVLTISSLLGGSGELLTVDYSAEDLGLPARLFEVIEHNQQYKKANNARRLDFEAHGVRAFLNIIFYYILPTSKVLLIDEPELFLYPSIRRKFGRMMAELSQAKKGNKQFICVTHDSDFMQGVIDTHCNVQILKLVKKSGRHDYTQCLFDEKFKPKDNKNVESYIQIPFLDCAILVEGATDRLIYEHVLSSKGFLRKYECKLISAFGAGCICHAEWMARQFKVPYAIILDFDVLKEKDEKIDAVLRLECVKDSDELKNKVISVSSKLKGIANIQNRGLRAISDDSLNKEVSELLLELKKIGVFIVPVGDVESWGNIGCLKKEFSEKFFSCYDTKEEDFKELDNFIYEVAQYLDQDTKPKKLTQI